MNYNGQCLLKLFLSVLGITALGIYVIQSGMLNLTEVRTRLLPSGYLQNIVFTKPSIGPFPSKNRSSCSCEGFSVTGLTVPAAELEDVQRRRSEEYRQYQLRMKTNLDTLILAPSNSPFQYPIQGVKVEPLQKSVIPALRNHVYFITIKAYSNSTGICLQTEVDIKGLLPRKIGLQGIKPEIETQDPFVSLSVKSGVLSVEGLVDGEQVDGQGQSKLTISSISLIQLNDLLSRVTYTSTIYHVKTKDLVHLSFEDYEAIFPIIIKRQSVPVLYDPGKDINSQVTIATKTFLRYEELDVLINSIRQFYPKIKIIVTDDSLIPEKVNGSNIEHYIMPPAQGWFAGRNLAVSQVTTKYFLWVDDDYIFHNYTRIESFVEIMEKVPELDVLGGAVGNNQFFFHLSYEEGDEEEGGCLRRLHRRKLQSIPGFNGCFFVDGVVNFFLARTDAVRRVGFDPFLKRVAHTEFFLDGLGDLMVATCKGLRVGHQKKRKQSKYRHFRFPGKSDGKHKMAHHYFKNHLKCMKY